MEKNIVVRIFLKDNVINDVDQCCCRSSQLIYEVKIRISVSQEDTRRTGGHEKIIVMTHDLGNAVKSKKKTYAI